MEEAPEEAPAADEDAAATKVQAMYRGSQSRKAQIKAEEGAPEPTPEALAVLA